MNANAVSQAGTQSVEGYTTAQKTEKKQKANYGKTIGAPELSEEGKKYYEQLKKKYSNMDFILVSEDMKTVAQANAGNYANANRMVVLIDEDKIERMATDEKYRKQYESIISNATLQLAQLKSSLNSSGNKVKTYGMQVNDGGLTSFFAVLEKSSKAQKERIKKSAEKKAEAKKKAKKAEEKKRMERRKTERANHAEEEEALREEEDTVTVTGSSIDELLRNIENYKWEQRSDEIETEEEKSLGQHIDFRG